MISAVLRCLTSLQQMALSCRVAFQPKPSIKALSHSDSTSTIALNAFFKRPAEALVFHCPAAFLVIRTGNYTKRYKTSAYNWVFHTGRFIMFSVITNIYNKKTKGPTLMELLTTKGKLRKVLFDN